MDEPTSHGFEFVPLAGGKSSDGSSASLPPPERAGPMFTRIFADVRATAMLADLLLLVRDWRTSVVIHDYVDIYGPSLETTKIAHVPGVQSLRPVTLALGAL